MKNFWKIKKTPDAINVYEDLYFMCKETMKTNVQLGVKYAKLLSFSIESHPKIRKGRRYNIFIRTGKKCYFGRTHDFDSYLLYVEWDREPDKSFMP